MTTKAQAKSSIVRLLKDHDFSTRKNTHRAQYAGYFVSVYVRSDDRALIVEIVECHPFKRSQETQNATHEYLYLTLCKCGYNVFPEQLGLFKINKPY